MRINDFNLNPSFGSAQNAKKRMDGDSFFKLMQESIKTGQPPGVAEPFSVGFTGEIEAIAARSRIMRTGAKNDVSDFLGLIKENRHLLLGVDVESLGLNENTLGQSALSEADAAALGLEFHPYNLTPEKQAALLKKLNSLGVLSADDIRSLKKSVTPSAGDLMDYLLNEPGFEDVAAISEDDVMARLKAMVNNEGFTEEHVGTRYGQNVAGVAALKAAHEKALKVLEQIKA